jgi:hypothetical protein
MAQTATNQGLTVQWDNVDIGYIADGSFDDNLTMVDCTTLDDTQVDNRGDLFDPSGSITVSLKDSNTVSLALNDVGELTVGELTRKVRISGLSQGAGVGAHRTITINFVSTAEVVST